MPCPGGYLGSLSFAIHADAQDPDSLKTIMYGTNNTSDPNYGTKGYIGPWLICTWAAFAVLAVELVLITLRSNQYLMTCIHSFEIIPHNVIGSAAKAIQLAKLLNIIYPGTTAIILHEIGLIMG